MDVADPAQAEPAPPRAPARVALGVVAWIALACLTSGMVAESQRWPSLWGGGSVFWSYAAPLWLGFGLLHVPGLVAGALALSIAAQRRDGGRLLVALALGALAAGAIMSWDVQFQSFRRSPWALYLVVDGLWLLAFASLWRGTRNAGTVGARLALFAFALPLAAAIATQWSMRQYFAEWRPATSEWDSRANLETLDFFPSKNRPLPRTADEGCAILARLAPDPYPRSGAPGGWPKRHRILRMYGAPVGERRPGEAPLQPVLSYEWWPERGAGECRNRGFAAAR